MQIADAWLKTDALGSNIPLVDITPAEAAVLNTNHEVNAKGVAVHDVIVTREEDRKNEAEIGRLREKYINAKTSKGEPLAEKLYPGKNPVLPQKFVEVGLIPISEPAKPTKESLPPVEAKK